MQPLGAQRRALHDAEAVLLVDDDEAERAKLQRLLRQRVRADDQVGGAARDLGVGLAPARGAVRLPVSDAIRNRDASSSRRIVR